MKRSYRLLSAVIALVTAFTLAGCGEEEKRKAECDLIVEPYVQDMSERFDDSFSVEYVSFSEAGNSCTYRVTSANYGDTFSVYVNYDDSVCDTYYALELLDTAKKEVGEVLEGVLPEGTEYTVSLNKHIIGGPEAGKYGTIKEAALAKPGFQLIILDIKYPDGFEKTDAAKADVFRALYENSLYSGIAMEGDDREFWVDDTGAHYWYRSGADGGAFIDSADFPLE